MRGSICSHNLVRCGLFWFICKWLNEIFLKATMMSLLCYQFAAKSLQSCPTLCDPRDGSPPGSPIPGILQARTLEWVAISFSNAWKWNVKVKSLSHARLLATPWTAAYQAPPSLGFSRQEYWSGMPLPSPPTLFTSSQKQEHICTRLKIPGSTYIPNPLPSVSQIAYKVTSNEACKVDGSVKIHYHQWTQISSSVQSNVNKSITSYL